MCVRVYVYVCVFKQQPIKMRAPSLHICLPLQANQTEKKKPRERALIEITDGV